MLRVAYALALTYEARAGVQSSSSSPPSSPPSGSATNGTNDWGVSTPACIPVTSAGSSVALRCEVDFDLGSYYEGVMGVEMSVSACGAYPRLTISAYEARRNQNGKDDEDPEYVELLDMSCGDSRKTAKLPYSLFNIPFVGSVNFVIYSEFSCGGYDQLYDSYQTVTYVVSVDICAEDNAGSTFCGEELKLHPSIQLPLDVYTRRLNTADVCPRPSVSACFTTAYCVFVCPHVCAAHARVACFPLSLLCSRAAIICCNDWFFSWWVCLCWRHIALLLFQTQEAQAQQRKRQCCTRDGSCVVHVDEWTRPLYAQALGGPD